MDEASRIQIAAKIKEVQRCVGNLHSTITNFLNAKKIFDGDKEVTSSDISEYMDRQVLHIQSQLREAASETAK